jgi:2',3'-cyclic-nucleotide 2'-phosphodiesterase (5'-nucleotidase family)
MSKPSDFPYFPGKYLSIEVRDRGIKIIGVTDDIKEPMLMGLIQVVEELRDETQKLKYEIKRLKEQS